MSTLQQLLQEGRQILKESGIAEWELDGWYLLEHVTGCSRNSFFLNPKKAVEEPEGRCYLELVQKRASHIPLQHLTGSQEFMGFPFLVNEHVLIPRQDTEVLVEEVCKYMKSGMHMLDMCTGSGCILLSVLKLCPGTTGVGVDLSEDALLVARQNKDQLEVQAELMQSDLFEKVEGRFDCIVSNPPYIPSEVVDTLMEEVRDHEPRMALDGSADGLHFYREIIQQSPAYLKPDGMLFFEIGYDQGEAVSQLMDADFEEVRVIRDLAGLDRVVCGKRKA